MFMIDISKEVIVKCNNNIDLENEEKYMIKFLDWEGKVVIKMIVRVFDLWRNRFFDIKDIF